MPTLIAPSILSANFLHLEKDIEMINQSEADWFHLDVMDGVFVPNISFGFAIIEKIALKAKKPLDVHLMIVDPDRYIERFRAAGAHLISIHVEACHHLHRAVYAIKNSGAKAGLVLNPASPVSVLENIVADADYILLMSVNPGFGGQTFIKETIEKVTALKDLMIRKQSAALIEVDGGVNLQNAPKLIHAGADVLVAGNAIFASPDPTGTIHKLKHL